MQRARVRAGAGRATGRACNVRARGPCMDLDRRDLAGCAGLAYVIRLTRRLQCFIPAIISGTIVYNIIPIPRVGKHDVNTYAHAHYISDEHVDQLINLNTPRV